MTVDPEAVASESSTPALRRPSGRSYRRFLLVCAAALAGVACTRIQLAYHRYQLPADGTRESRYVLGDPVAGISFTAFTSRSDARRDDPFSGAVLSQLWLWRDGRRELVHRDLTSSWARADLVPGDYELEVIDIYGESGRSSPNGDNLISFVVQANMRADVELVLKMAPWASNQAAGQEIGEGLAEAAAPDSQSREHELEGAERLAVRVVPAHMPREPVGARCGLDDLPGPVSLDAGCGRGGSQGSGGSSGGHSSSRDSSSSSSHSSSRDSSSGGHSSSRDSSSGGPSSSRDSSSSSSHSSSRESSSGGSRESSSGGSSSGSSGSSRDSSRSSSSSGTPGGSFGGGSRGDSGGSGSSGSGSSSREASSGRGGGVSSGSSGFGGASDAGRSAPDRESRESGSSRPARPSEAPRSYILQPSQPSPGVRSFQAPTIIDSPPPAGSASTGPRLREGGTPGEVRAEAGKGSRSSSDSASGYSSTFSPIVRTTTPAPRAGGVPRPAGTRHGRIVRNTQVRPDVVLTGSSGASSAPGMTTQPYPAPPPPRTGSSLPAPPPPRTGSSLPAPPPPRTGSSLPAPPPPRHHSAHVVRPIVRAPFLPLWRRHWHRDPPFIPIWIPAVYVIAYLEPMCDYWDESCVGGGAWYGYPFYGAGYAFEPMPGGVGEEEATAPLSNAPHLVSFQVPGPTDRNGEIRLKFDRPMDPFFFDPVTIELSTLNGQQVGAGVYYLESAQEAVFHPLRPLEPGSYQVNVYGQLLYDLGGSSLEGNYQQTFAIGLPGPGPVSEAP